MRHSTWAVRAGLWLLLAACLVVAVAGVVRLPQLKDFRPRHLLAGWNVHAEELDFVVICPSPLLHPEIPSVVVMRWDWVDLPAVSMELPEFLCRYSPNLPTGRRVP